jgi:glycine/D-amino acid oxidase-like deaminating enzyme
MFECYSILVPARKAATPLGHNPRVIHSEYDVVVLGAGGAGMTAAFVAAHEGARVLVLEKTAYVGGTTSRSAGTLWVPGNPFMPEADARDDVEAARRYLDALIGERGDSRLRDQFLRHGPRMVRYLQLHGGVQFNPCPRHADYHPDLDGGRRGGRPVEAAVFDGRGLGRDFALLRPPLREFMVLGGMMVSKADIDALVALRGHRANRSHAAALVLRYARDRLTHPRGTRLTMGNALCAALLKALRVTGATLVTQARVVGAARIGATAHSLVVDVGGQPHAVVSTRALVFAGGGFSGNVAWRDRHLPRPTPTHTVACECADASTQTLALTLGATLGETRGHNAWWFPSSVVPRHDGTAGVFPHIVLDRAKPGLIAVDRRGRRFVNEGTGYHTFGLAQYAAHAIPSWLVCDSRFIQRYGLGAVRPGGRSLRAWVRRGYVTEAASLDALGRAIGVDAEGLRDSAARMNAYAATGHDPDFGKGADALSRQNGDPTHTPNPCLGRIDSAPFYAVEVRPADLGTSLGLRTSAHAEPLDADGNALRGLYACGNDMDSIMGGEYPAPGVTLGPGMTFAYVAALHALGKSVD